VTSNTWKSMGARVCAFHSVGVISIIDSSTRSLVHKHLSLWAVFLSLLDSKSSSMWWDNPTVKRAPLCPLVQLLLQRPGRLCALPPGTPPPRRPTAGRPRRRAHPHPRRLHRRLRHGVGPQQCLFGRRRRPPTTHDHQPRRHHSRSCHLWQHRPLAPPR
jgi:hypothetical protein